MRILLSSLGIVAGILVFIWDYRQPLGVVSIPIGLCIAWCAGCAIGGNTPVAFECLKDLCRIDQ